MHKMLLILLLLPSWGMLKAQPTGIYILDSNQGTYRDANIRDYTFVDGYVWRTAWAEIETAQGVYDYAGLDHIIHKLDSLNQQLTILFSAYTPEPTYIALQIGAATYPYTHPITQVSSTRSVPWDAFLMQRYRLLLADMANHPVYSIAAGTKVALKDHPVLANISTGIPGLGAIRNVNGNGTNINTIMLGYSRAKLTDSIVASLEALADNFPSQNIFIPFYKDITDNQNNPPLATFIRTQLLQRFDDVQYPKISFWQENLAAYKDTITDTIVGLPRTTYATPLVGLNDSAYTMFQMLQGWTTPFQDSTKTAGTTPIDGMCYAYHTYGTTYFEIYLSDIESPTYQPMIAAWAPSTCDTIEVAIEEAVNSIAMSIYPNPATKLINIAGLQPNVPYTITAYNLMGQQIGEQSNAAVVNVSAWPVGAYMLSIRQGSQVQYLRFLKD